MILRGLTGLTIGAVYGSIVTGLVFLLTRIGLDETKTSSLIMLDPVAMAWLATVLSGLIAGVCAALVGLVVAIGRLDTGKAAMTGFVTGLLALGLMSINSTLPTSFRDWIELFVAIALLPIGVAIIGVVVSIVADRL